MERRLDKNYTSQYKLKKEPINKLNKRSYIIVVVWQLTCII